MQSTLIPGVRWRPPATPGPRAYPNPLSAVAQRSRPAAGAAAVELELDTELETDDAEAVERDDEELVAILMAGRRPGEGPRRAANAPLHYILRTLARSTAPS